MKPAVEEMVLTVEEAAVLLRVSKGTVYGLCRERRLPSLKLGRRWVIPRGALLELLGGKSTHEGESQAHQVERFDEGQVV